MGSRPWPLEVTWRHRSRDHSTHGGRLPMGGPLWQCIYLAPLWRYGRLKFFQEQRSVIGWSSIGRSVLNITLISYTPLRYVRNVACEKQKCNQIKTHNRALFTSLTDHRQTTHSLQQKKQTSVVCLSTYGTSVREISTPTYTPIAVWHRYLLPLMQ